MKSVMKRIKDLEPNEKLFVVVTDDNGDRTCGDISVSYGDHVVFLSNNIRYMGGRRKEISTKYRYSWLSGTIRSRMLAPARLFKGVEIIEQTSKNYNLICFEYEQTKK